MVKKARLRKELEKEIKFDPKNFLRNVTPQIECISGFNIPAALIDQLEINEIGLINRILSRIFDKTHLLGLSISKGSVYLSRRRIINFIIDNYGVSEINSDPEKRKQVISDVEIELKAVLVHEFVHYVHRNLRPEDFATFFECIRLISQSLFFFGRDSREQLIREKVAGSITAEAIALGITDIIFNGETAFGGLSQEFFMIALAIEPHLDKLDRGKIDYIQLALLLEGDYPHAIATRFVTFARSKYGDDVIKEILRRPPTFEQLVWTFNFY